MAIYVVYENDQYQFEGEPQEVAARLNVKVETVKWYSTPTGLKRQAGRKKQRREIIKLED